MATHIASATNSADTLSLPRIFLSPMVRGLREREPRKARGGTVERARCGAFSAAVRLGAAVEGPARKAGVAVVSGYVFVRLALRDRLQVLQVPGVAKLVGFNGSPTALPQEEIAALRTSLANGVRADPHPHLAAGRRVRVKSGSLAGLEGVLVRKKNSTRFVISLDLIMRSVAVDIEGSEVEPV